VEQLRDEIRAKLEAHSAKTKAVVESQMRLRENIKVGATTSDLLCTPPPSPSLYPHRSHHHDVTSTTATFSSSPNTYDARLWRRCLVPNSWSATAMT
jgi:hypothetical protein